MTTETGLLVGQIITFLGVVAVAAFGVWQRKARTPKDENESMRLGNEFLRGLLEDARKEREELRQTINELRDSELTKQETIDRLTALLRSKDSRIGELERRLEFMARKLQSGEHITITDVIGKGPETATS